MAYVNLASATKLARTSQIISAIGSGGFMQLWTTTPPPSPDITSSGELLVSLPLSSVAAVGSYGVESGLVTAPGTGGTNGLYDLTITGSGSGAAGTYTVAGGVLSAITITVAGENYATPPTLGGFGTAGLTGATATAVMTATLIFNTISTATAVATGIAGWARVTNASLVGIIDLDVGTTNASSVVMGNTYIAMGGSVACSAQVMIEA